MSIVSMAKLISVLTMSNDNSSDDDAENNVGELRGSGSDRGCGGRGEQESASALFIDGMDPVCKAIVQFHRKVNMEYDDLVRSLSMLQEGERKVLELRRHFETRIVFGFAEKIHLRSAGHFPTLPFEM